MAYRRTERVRQHLAARQNAIVVAARMLAEERGMSAVQILPVAERAGIAAGTVYRYFPSKTDLVTGLIDTVAERELAAIRAAADAAPGRLSALAAGMITFAARMMRRRRLAWALIAEPVDAEVDPVRLTYRRALASEFEQRIRAAMEGEHLPEQDSMLSAAALLGAMLEALVGPLAPEPPDDRAKMRKTVQDVTLIGLRTLGVLDARARGLVVQAAWPAEDEAG